MAGVKALRRIQFGVESTAAHGTIVPATTKWFGTGTLQDMIDIRFPEEDIGNLGGTAYNFPASWGGEIVMEQDALFEQIPYVFSAGVLDADSGVVDGAGTGYIYTYNVSTTAQQECNTYTIEAGDDAQAEIMPYAFVRSFTINGAGGDPLHVSATWQGWQVSDTGSFTSDTAATFLPTRETIIFSKGKLYIDDDTGTLGTTLKSNLLLGMTLNVTTGFTAVRAADGSLNFSFLKQSKPEIALDLTFEHAAASYGEKAAWRLGTAKQLKLIFEGSTLTTGATYTKKTFIINLAGAWERFSNLGEQDGNDVLTGTFRGKYSPTANTTGLFGQFIVVLNSVLDLP
jgi:hypothetical protein